VPLRSLIITNGSALLVGGAATSRYCLSGGLHFPGARAYRLCYKAPPDKKEILTMKPNISAFLVFVLFALPFTGAWADEDSPAEQEKKYQDTIKIFEGAGQSGTFFDNSYGYAVFPTIGKAGFIVGGSYGKGRVYEQGEYVGDSSVGKGSIGFQAGAQAYSQIVFFEDKRAFDDFTSGNFEFDANASAVAITAGASAGASTAGGTSAGASGGKHDATTKGGYRKGMAVFTVAKGGLMFEASIGGQKFGYTPLAK
jgi:lipid-binding SYLF domain-containing protein